MKKQIILSAIFLLCSFAIKVYAQEPYPFKNYENKWGYEDFKKRTVIPAQYKKAGHFNNTGFAYVQDNEGKYAFIDITGKRITKFKYDFALDPKNGYARVYVGDYKTAKWGLVDKTGKEIIPLKYDYLGDLIEGLIIVRLNGKIGFIDITGKEIIPMKYDGASDFSEGLANVRVGDKETGKWGFIDKTGKEIVSPKYDKESHGFNEGLCFVVLNGKYGYIDNTGNEIILPKYENTDHFSEGLAYVKLNGKYGYIDKTEKEVIPFIYDEAGNFIYGTAKVKLKGDEFEIDKTGRSEEYEKLIAERKAKEAKEINPKTITVNSLGRALPDMDVLLMIMTEGVMKKNKETIFTYSGYLGISGFTLSDKVSDNTRLNNNTGKKEECICYKSNENVFDGLLPLFVFLFKNGDIEVYFYINSPDKHTELYKYFKEKTNLVGQNKSLDYFGLGNNDSMAIISILNGKRTDGTQGSLNGGSCSIYNYTKK